ncbi:MAG TPA: HlyD family efflux transporter periplasmic adaptor subunit [Myxococcaceae bacterium]|nr:HlyD family efflux transporter periplasmic adaptor subunit [Myxococcaceae bacterium]
MAEPASDLFRKEALDYHQGSTEARGSVLQISPAWLRYAYWVLVAVAIGGAIFSTVATVNEYASGPAVVRVQGRTDLTAKAPGTVGSVDVVPGQRVYQGMVLVRMYTAQEAGELERLTKEFNLQMTKSMRDPSDKLARQTLATLRTQRDLAEERLEERIVRAPHAGVVSDLRIRPGEALNMGETILSLYGEQTKYTLLAMLPGRYRPMLKTGMPIRLELAGFKYVYQNFAIEGVGNEVIGPAELRRFLGQELADTVSVTEPVVVVTARLPKSTFIADGRTFGYYEGMQGSADARVRAESVLVTLIPGLKALFDDGG